MLSMIMAGLGLALQAIKMGAEYMEKNKKEIMLTVNNGSMTKFISKYIVEPTAIVSKDLSNEDILDRLLEIEADIFASYYMQVFDIMTNVYGVKATMAIELLSTDTMNVGAMASNGKAMYKLATEDFDYTADLLLSDTLSMPLLSTEAHPGNLGVKGGNNNNNYKGKPHPGNLGVNGKPNNNKQQGGSNTTNDVAAKELAKEKFKELIDAHTPVKDTRGASIKEDFINKNLPGVIQRNINLEIVIDSSNNDEIKGSGKDFKRIITVPILIKLNIIYTDTQNILTMFKPNSGANSWSNRFDSFKSGAIALGDLVFANDLIKEYKKTKIEDRDNLLNLINNKSANANAKLLSNKAIGFEKYYNMLLITKEELVLIEKIVGGKIKDNKYKEKLLADSNSLMVTVIDRDYERVQIHTKDIHGTSDITYKALSKKGGKGEDLSEIFKSMIANRPPVF